MLNEKTMKEIMKKFSKKEEFLKELLEFQIVRFNLVKEPTGYEKYVEWVIWKEITEM